MLFRLLETYGWLGTIIWDWCTRFWGWVTDDASGFFTMLLAGIAVFQLGMFYRQLSFMRASLAEAKSATIAATEAAKTAKLNAQAVINAERAYLWPGFPTCSPQPDGNSVLWHGLHSSIPQACRRYSIPAKCPRCHPRRPTCSSCGQSCPTILKRWTCDSYSRVLLASRLSRCAGRFTRGPGQRLSPRHLMSSDWAPTPTSKAGSISDCIHRTRTKFDC